MAVYTKWTLAGGEGVRDKIGLCYGAHRLG